MAEDTVTITNRQMADLDNFKCWWCDGSWTATNGALSITNTPFTYVHFVHVVPVTGTWPTAWECTTLGKLSTAGTVSFTGFPTGGAAATGRIFIWGY